MLIDLQVHSTYSDGYLAPEEVARFLNSKNVKVASLTDHNTMRGLEQFKEACAKYGIRAVNGMEVYSKYKNKKINILWYNFDPDHPELHKMLRDSQIRRRAQVRAVLASLVREGFKIDIERTLDKYTHYIPINRIANDFAAIPENMRKIKKDLKLKQPLEEDVIREYFRNGRIGRLKNAYINIKRIMVLKKKVGGQLIWCHPAKHEYVMREDLAEMKKLGLDGVEILSPHHSYNAVMYLQGLCREFDMIETAGTDFHRLEGSNYPIQSAYDYAGYDTKLLKGINEIIG